jgi:hypothetical protein
LSADLLTREQSATWFFKTRKGSIGLLQITGFTENPRGVKIRYKLVQSGGGPQITLPTKTIMLTGATNQLSGASNDVWIVTVWTESILFPGEELQSKQRLPDGQNLHSMDALFITTAQGKTGTTCGFTWFFRGGFGKEEAEAAVAQIRETKSERPLALAAGKPLELFSVTNRYGGGFAGSLEFARSAPQPLAAGKKAQASIRLRPYNGLLVFYNATVPPGYFLEATDNSADFGEGRAYTHINGISERSTSWSAPQSFTHEEQLPVSVQLQQLAAQGPLKVIFGEPRQVFSITN